MKHSTKVWLGAASFWPLIYIALFAMVVLGIAALTMATTFPQGGDPEWVFMAFPLLIFAIMPLHFLTIFGGIALIAYFNVLLATNKALPDRHKAVWAVLLIVLQIFAAPFFWYFVIWKAEGESPLTGGR